MRLSKAARNINQGISSIVNILRSHGIMIDPNPNSRLTPEQYDLLCKHLNVENDFRSESAPILMTPDENGLIDTSSEKKTKIDALLEDLITTRRRTIGQITYFNHERGFGFVKCFEVEIELFIHISKIIVKPINEKDYVVFKVERSNKKVGSYSAFELNLISTVLDQHYLRDIYLQFPIKDFQAEIIKILSSASLVEVFSREIDKVNIVETQKDYDEFKEIISKINKANVNEQDHLALKNRINETINNKCSAVFQNQLWVDSIIDYIPQLDRFVDFFNHASENQRLAIFQRLDNSLKNEIIEKNIKVSNPEEVLDFIIKHLHKVNKLGYFEDVKSKLFKENYWNDKIDYTLYIETLNKLRNILDDLDLIKLFIKKYINTIPVEIIITSIGRLSRVEITAILESPSLTKTENYLIINSLLEISTNNFNSKENIPDESFALRATDEDWKKYNEQEAEPFCWLIRISKEKLTESKLKLIEKSIISGTAPYIHLILWENKLSDILPDKGISDFFLNGTDFYGKIEEWLTKEIITKDKVVEIVLSNLKNLQEVQGREHFYSLLYHLTALEKMGIKVESIEIPLQENNTEFFNLALWIGDFSPEFNYEQFSKKLPFLNPGHQILFLRKLFKLTHEKNFDLTLEKLDSLTRIDLDIFKLNQQFNQDIPLDISVHIIIEAIKSFATNGQFLLDSDLLKIILHDISPNKKHKFQISELFEKCEGRLEAKYNWKTKGEISKIPFGENQFYYAIQFELGEMQHNGRYDYFVPSPYFQELKEKVKLLPGRKWNSEKNHWGIPSRYESQVMNFAKENRFFLEGAGDKYTNNIHLAEFKRTETTPNGIKYCEGRLSNKRDRRFNREFWWCCNQPCFANCETIHSSEDWQKYTLLDFLTILGFNMDDGNSVGDYIEKGKYYQFISLINRFNRLLKRMYCEVCNNILYPVEDSHFAYYRVTRFNCLNESCSEYKKEIYLHHCLNGKCNNVIDSRKSKKCPNGLYICDNEECGCCCSHDMLNRRLENLKTTGGFIHQNLITLVNNLGGHLERGVHYCYNCGGIMLDLQNDVFKCNECNIQYDVSKNMFKRPHRHIRTITPHIDSDQYLD